MVNTAFACQFTWGVNFKAKAVFTIFALYLTLVCTFCTKFALSKFVVNPIFRAVPLPTKAPYIWRKVGQGKKVNHLSERTLGEPTSFMFPYKTWRTVYVKGDPARRAIYTHFGSPGQLAQG